jgi:hypothetical protein
MCLKRLIVSVLLVYPVCLSGCSQPQVAVSDLAQAHQVAQQVLDAWKSGSTMDDLKKLSPPIIVSEDLWRKQVTLRSYQFKGEGALLGPNARFEIQLNYSDADGKNMEKSFTYLVTTTPAITFFREER